MHTQNIPLLHVLFVKYANLVNCEVPYTRIAIPACRPNQYIESAVTKIIIYMPLNRNFSVSTVQYMLKEILSVSKPALKVFRDVAEDFPWKCPF